MRAALARWAAKPARLPGRRRYVSVGGWTVELLYMSSLVVRPRWWGQRFAGEFLLDGEFVGVLEVPGSRHAVAFTRDRRGGRR